MSPICMTQIDCRRHGPHALEKIFLAITKSGSPVQAGNVLVKMKQVIKYALRENDMLQFTRF